MLLTSENYFSSESDREHLSTSQYKNFMGTYGKHGCEAYAMAKLNGALVENMEDSDALMIGSYVDSSFEGTLDLFKNQHPCMFKKDGSLMAKYVHAEKMIQRCERDPEFMKYMSGQKQVIMTANMFGSPWKIKIDSYHPGKCIVDLKTCQSITKVFYHKDFGYMNFLSEWGYYIQMAVYQNVEYLNQLSKCRTEEEKAKCHKLPCYIAAVSKEKVPRIKIIAVEQSLIDEALVEIERNTPKIVALKNGEYEPIRCELCDYCAETEVLTGPIWSSDLLGEC